MTLWLWNFKSLFTFISATYGMMLNTFFIAIPLFIFMGVLLQRSGIAESLFQTIYMWSGRLRGGMAMGTVIICAIFAAMTGVTGAACITMGLVALPAMRKRGYDKSLALGTVAAPSTLGILIPPSIIMIQLAIIGETSVGGLFMAGMGPGLLMALLFIIYIFIKGLVQPQSCPASPESYSWRQKFVSLKSVIAPLLIIVSVLGSIFAGIATPTEAAAVGVAAIMITTAVNRTLNWKVTHEATIETFRVTALTMWLIFTAVAFAAVYAALGSIRFVSELLLGLEMGRWAIIIIIMVLIFIMGTFIEPAAIIWIVGPLSYPIIKELGFDPTWYGALFVINICIAYVTPPFGVNLFYLKAIVPRDISMGDIFRSVWPFIAVMIVTLIFIMVFPEIALWLPKLMLQLRG